MGHYEAAQRIAESVRASHALYESLMRFGAVIPAACASEFHRWRESQSGILGHGEALDVVGLKALIK